METREITWVSAARFERSGIAPNQRSEPVPQWHAAFVSHYIMVIWFQFDPHMTIITLQCKEGDRKANESLR